MSDYTPTTGAVRIAHWRGTAFRSADHVREDAAFDRWLAKVKAEQDKATTERIIGLLENHYPQNWLNERSIVHGLVSLIKGENK